jgi:hypothetical protein
VPRRRAALGLRGAGRHGAEPRQGGVIFLVV